MFERFTDEARAIVVQAQNAARDLRHSYIGCEHLLLGMLRAPDSIPARSLVAAGADFDAVRDRVLGHSPSGDAESVGQMPFTPRAKKALELALREARRLDADHIESAHVLLGVLRTDDNLACAVLGELGIDIAALRESVEAALPAADPIQMSVRQRLRGAGRPFARITETHVGGIQVEPCDDVRRLMMSAAARALDDGRTRIEVADVDEALRRWHDSGDPPAAATG